MRALPLSFLLLSLACGDGSDPDALAKDTAAPQRWSAGDRFAQVSVDRLTRDPLLGEPECSVQLFLGEANGDGAFAGTDSEGACFVGMAPVLLPGATITPLDGGTLDLRVGGSVERVTIDASSAGSSLPFECSELESARTVGVTSLADESPTDALGAFAVEIPLQAAPTFESPPELRAGIAAWDDSGDLEVAWNGGLGDSVEVVLGSRDGSGPMVRCFAEDDGRFIIPARLVDELRSAPATLEVTRVGLEVRSVDDVEVRLVSRSSTQLWLELRE